MTIGPALSSPPKAVAAAVVDLCKTYGGGETRVDALDHVTTEFARGRLTAIMGPSGSGKSTLLHIMAGLDKATSGTVHVGDVELGTLDDKALSRLRRDHVGFVFQSYNLLPTLTARENITLPQDIAGRTADPVWLETVIDAVGIRTRLAHRPGELSGGQQQKVACARALAGRPKIVFADEPTGNLDSSSGAEVLAFLRHSTHDLGQTVVMVTHDPVAASYADRVVFLVDGRLVDELAEPTADSVLQKLRSLDSTVRRG